MALPGIDQKTNIVNQSRPRQAQEHSAAPREQSLHGLRRPGVPLLQMWVSGSQTEMGAQHGRLVREAGGYEEILEYYPRMIEILLAGDRGPALRIAARLAIGCSLRLLERQRPPAYRERARAFVAALGYPESHARFLCMMDVFQNLVGLAGRLGVGASRRISARAARPACSTLMAWGRASAGGQLRHARNFDLFGAGLWDRHPAVVFCTPRQGLRYGFVTARGVDLPGVTVFNEAGLSVTTQTCFHRQVRFDGIGVVDLGHEIIRRAESLDDAVRIIRERPVASPWALSISSARERRGLVAEITAQQVEVVRPAAGRDFLAQTNRFRSPAMLKHQIAPAPGFVAHADGRLEALDEAAAASQARGGLGRDELMALLGSHHEPEIGEERAAGGVLGQSGSVQSVVIEPEQSCIHVSVGPTPTGKGPYVGLPWTWDEPVGCREVACDVASISGAPDEAGRSRFSDGPAREGFEAYLDAVRHHDRAASSKQVARELERAVSLDPDEPTYRFLAGAYALRHGELDRATAHLGSGLEREHSPYRRGQLLLWASRAAAARSDRQTARAHREELLRLEHPLLADYQTAARRDAWRLIPRTRYSGLQVDPMLVDVIG